MSALSSVVPQSQSARQSARQTRTNPSRTSKTLGRSSFAYGHADTLPAPSVPRGFYPALTHFTDAITALPREFRRHNSLLKEVDAKAWALEENLLQLLKVSSESQAVPYPPNPAPIVGGVLREDIRPQDPSQPPESQESKNRRLLFDRVRLTLTDLMMTADEKNHVISNANDELDRQTTRLDTVFPFIAGEISDESRLGSLTHWAYTNRNTATKATTNERPRREAAAARELAMHEAEAFSRTEARREAVLARKHRRGHGDEFEEPRSGGRKSQGTKARTAENGADHTAGAGAAPKRRKVERQVPAEGATMERTASGTSTVRAPSKDVPTSDAKKRSRAPNTNAASRKRNNRAAESPAPAPSPLVGTFSAPGRATSPVFNATSRPQSSRAPQHATQSNNRIRPSSSTSNRHDSTFSGPGPALGLALSNVGGVDKEGRREALSRPGGGVPGTIESKETDDAAKIPAPVDTKREEPETKPAESVETGDPPAAQQHNSKGRSSKTSTPQLPAYEPAQPRARPTRSTNPGPKRSHKKNDSVPVPPRAPSEDEESIHEGDDEDEDGEPRYCYCNEVSFGEMVACDNDACPREWFHLSCVGMTKPPGKNVKWYCNECKDNMRRSRSGR